MLTENFELYLSSDDSFPLARCSFGHFRALLFYQWKSFYFYLEKKKPIQRAKWWIAVFYDGEHKNAMPLAIK